MKIIKEHINEKFTEDSDPISDMGIGVNVKFKKYIKNELGVKNSNDIDIYKFGTSAAYGYDAILCKITCDNKSVELAEYVILAKNANPACYNSLSLRWAAARGNVEMIKLLIEHGANPNDSDSGSSVDCAVSYNQKEALKYLIKIGGRFDTTTPREVEFMFKNEPEYIKELKKQNII